MSHAIKVRMIGKKKWSFLTRRGTNPLLVHAVQFATPEKAQTLINENRQENPEWNGRSLISEAENLLQLPRVRACSKRAMVEPVAKTLITKRLL